MAKKRKVYCCLYCGRDTTSRSKICKQCTGGKEHDDSQLPDVWELIDEREGTDDNEQEDDQ